MNLKKDLSQFDRVLVIHHWDTDGICSASLIKDELESATAVNRTPKIGSYQLTEKILAEASEEYDAIIIADIRLSDMDLGMLTKIFNAKILLFDHHIGKAIPGILSVQDSLLGNNRGVYPSTSWLVKIALQLPIGLRSILGVVGDKGHLEFSDPKDLEDAQRFLSRQKLDEKILQRMTDLLDSNARVGDESLVESAVSSMSRDGEDATALLKNRTWNSNAQVLEEEIEQQMKTKDELHNGIAVKRVHSKFDIVSAVARRMAWSGKYRTAIALNSGFLSDEDQLYVRKGTDQLDSRAIIRLARQKGYSAGGKDEVVGAVIPRTQSQDFLQEVLATVGDRI